MEIKEFIDKLGNWLRDPTVFSSEYKPAQLQQWQKDMVKFVIENRPIPRGWGKSTLWWDYETILISAYNHIKGVKKDGNI